MFTIRLVTVDDAIIVRTPNGWSLREVSQCMCIAALIVDTPPRYVEETTTRVVVHSGQRGSTS